MLCLVRIAGSLNSRGLVCVYLTAKSANLLTKFQPCCCTHWLITEFGFKERRV